MLTQIKAAHQSPALISFLSQNKPPIVALYVKADYKVVSLNRLAQTALKSVIACPASSTLIVNAVTIEEY